MTMFHFEAVEAKLEAYSIHIAKKESRKAQNDNKPSFRKLLQPRNLSHRHQILLQAISDISGTVLKLHRLR